MRYVRQNWRPNGKPSGVFLTRGHTARFVFFSFWFGCASVPLALPPPAWWPSTWAGPTAMGPNRAELESQLLSRPGQHLVIVRYLSSHDPNFEWVYNSADIDNSKIVWARDMGAANKELLDYYPRRAVWFADADTIPPRPSSLPCGIETLDWKVPGQVAEVRLTRGQAMPSIQVPRRTTTGCSRNRFPIAAVLWRQPASASASSESRKPRARFVSAPETFACCQKHTSLRTASRATTPLHPSASHTEWSGWKSP